MVYGNGFITEINNVLYNLDVCNNSNDFINSCGGGGGLLSNDNLMDIWKSQ